MSSEALSPKQFYTENAMTEQGNEDQVLDRVRGIQNMTSNVYKPAFSSDYTKVQSMPSGTAFGGDRSGAGMEEDEDEEA
jgi:hypothetical protein